MQRNIAVLADGKFLLAGAANISNWDFAIAKYNADGSLDTTFGTGGKVTLHISGNDNINGITIRNSGKILVCGEINATPNYDAAMALYNANGILDTTFGTNGIVTVTFTEANDSFNNAIELSDGKILLAAGVGDPGANFAITRYTTILNTKQSFLEIHLRTGSFWQEEKPVAIFPNPG
ncbi:MAG: hypothetical protein HUU50_21955 [Candidatus Brocadiae bacterium]|nr:hypothetical protein [Candidatus Brocadiia bacterium]